MGVDFTHCDAHWAYSGFHRFRCRLASEIGITLDVMEGYGGERSWDNIQDAIVPLLHHSDCEDDLSPEDCTLVAPRIRELVASWDDDEYDKRMALELASGMEAAALAGERLEFC